MSFKILAAFALLLLMNSRFAVLPQRFDCGEGEDSGF
jgi:hypothetical protein